MSEYAVNGAKAFEHLGKLIAQHKLDKDMQVSYTSVSDSYGNYEHHTMAIGGLYVQTWTVYDHRMSRDTFDAMCCCILSETPEGCPLEHAYHATLPEGWRG